MVKLFGTDGIRGKANIYPMTAEIALLVGRAVAYHVMRSHRPGSRKPRVLIGKDTRLSCYMLENAIASGLCSCGVDVLLTGPLPTPAISYITKQMRAAAGIVISASHNVYSDNGIKIFGSDGLKLTDIEELALEECVLTDRIKDYRAVDLEIGKITRIDHAYGRYVTFLKQNFPEELDLVGMRIVLDCANGASYKVAPTVMEELGAEVHAYGTGPDGVNINRDCGAIFPQHISRLVRKHRAHIGIALDGDADRVVLVDEKGNTVDGDQIMAITAIDMIKRKELRHSTVVATVMSNIGLDLALRNHGGKLVRTKVGDRYVVEEMKRNGYNLGGEKSGHLIFSDALFTGDGLLGALRVLAVMKKGDETLSKLASGITLYPQHLKSIDVKKKEPLENFPEITKKVSEIKNKLGDSGRIVLRFSGTEPKIRLMMEGREEKKLPGLMKELEKTIRREFS